MIKPRFETSQSKKPEPETTPSNHSLKGKALTVSTSVTIPIAEFRALTNPPVSLKTTPVFQSFLINRFARKTKVKYRIRIIRYLVAKNPMKLSQFFPGRNEKTEARN